MNNVNAIVKDGILTVTVDLKKEGKPSSTGKTMIVASSEGNANIEGGFKLGLNVFKSR